MQRYLVRLYKGLFWLIPIALILVLLLVSIGPGLVQANPGWYNASWSYRKPIEIDHTKVSSTQTNFPLLINLSSNSDLAAKALANG
ncbi:hypothetical protein ACFLVN_02600 [Chloroflexota bacterium]